MRQKDKTMYTIPKERASTTAGLREEIGAALLRQSSKTVYTPPKVLVALDRLLVKTKRIAKVLGCAAPSVSQMLAGQRPVPAKYEGKLLMLLRDAVHLAREECDKAEAGAIRYKGNLFPATAIAFMRKRADEAEQVLKAYEQPQ